MTTIPASRTPASEARPAPGRTFVAFLTMASAIIVGVMTLLAGPASASTLTSTQNVVGVIGHAGGQRVGAHEGVLAGQGRARAPNYDRMASASCVGADGGASGIDAFDLKMSSTVEQHISDLAKDGSLARPYADSRLTIQNIMDAGTPVADPGGVPGALRWDVPGSLNGSSGNWELVVDPQTNTILHFLFKSG